MSLVRDLGRTGWVDIPAMDLHICSREGWTCVGEHRVYAATRDWKDRSGKSGVLAGKTLRDRLRPEHLHANNSIASYGSDAAQLAPGGTL